jgi:hypothetical protein
MRFAKMSGRAWVPISRAVGKPARDDEGGGDAFAFEERVGGDGCAHLDGADAGGGDGGTGGKIEELADGMEGCVVIGAGVDGEDFADVEAAGGVARDDIGEGAAAVDEELPFLMVCCGGGHCFLLLELGGGIRVS